VTEEQVQLNKSDDWNRLHNPGTRVKWFMFSGTYKTTCISYVKDGRAVVQLNNTMLACVDQIKAIDEPIEIQRDELIKSLVAGYRSISGAYKQTVKGILTAPEYDQFEKIIRGENNG
jgi:hypothetical protein